MEVVKPDVEKAVQALKDGKVLVCPTDTVYGLICDSGNREAVEKLYKIKKRPKNKPIPLFVSGLEMARGIAEINEEQEKFLKNVWPGATTCVLSAKGGGGTVGLRMPKHDFVISLIGGAGRPLAETSANISGQAASTKIKDALECFEHEQDQPDLVIDGGDLPPSNASTVVDLRFSPPKILRQ